MSIHVITDEDRVATYGACIACGAPCDAWEVEYADGTKTMNLVCTASASGNLCDWQWGHSQD